MGRLSIAAAVASCLIGFGAPSMGQFQSGNADLVRSPLLDGRAIAAQRFQAEHPGAALYRLDGQIRRVYGQAFSRGETAEASAEQFLEQHLAMFGVSRENLREAGPFPDGRHVQPVMYDREADTYRFTGLYYTQELDGIPVFRSRLTLLIRNEADNPLVLASVDLRDLGHFRVAPQALGHTDLAAGRAAIKQQLQGEPRFGDANLVIWAGVEGQVAEPRLAFKQVVEIGDVTVPDTYGKWLYLTDAFTGAELYRENLVLHGGIEGSVGCLCTIEIGAGLCHEPELTPMPYARIVANGEVIYADADGNFTIPDVGSETVLVQSAVRGLFFRVFNQAGANAEISETVSVPGTVNLLHNASDANELSRAEVDVYYHSNVVRDYALVYNPDYPVIANQTEFTINVNINQNCNATYNGSAINFYTSGAGCANTGFDTVVYHEYGHHLVATGGSGQGAYGEGMSDSVAVLITDDPILGLGFNQNCNFGIRNADNNHQYPCSGGIHFCGQLLSGCVWSTRTELLATHPETYRDIISGLTINSILLHTGTSIDPSITIDFLTLDDDDDDIFNGTPHYHQIQAGFSAHNMDGPQLDYLRFFYPDGLPEILTPGQPTAFLVEVEPLLGDPEPGTATLHVRTGGTGAFEEIVLQQVSLHVYEAVLPAVDCATSVEFFLSAVTTEGDMQTSPREAPDDSFAALSATGLVTLFSDPFNEDLGWTVGAPDDDATTGHWVLANPVGTTNGGEQAQPSEPFTGKMCYITGQHPGGNPGANDVDHGKTTLFSPIFDLSDAVDATISYWRWYSNHAGANPFNDIFEVDISADGGKSWVSVEVVGPTGPEVMGGWYQNLFLVSDFVPLTDEIQMRFVASDYDPQALVEAAVDLFEIQLIECDDVICPGDLNGDGVVDVFDLLTLLAAWGECDGCVEDLNADGVVDVFDLMALLEEWGACP